MGNLWYPHFPGDYARDTGDLTLMEHGAYRLLLDHYYSTGAPLPADKQRIFRLCRAFHPEEQEAVCAVLSDFFSLQLDGYHNGRADRQLIKMAEQRAKQSEKGRRGAAKRWNGTGNGPANGTGNGRAIAKPNPDPYPEPNPNPQSEKRNPNVGEADVSQNPCDVSPENGDAAGSPPEIIKSLSYRELKGKRTTLLSSLRQAHRVGLAEPCRAVFQKELEQVERLLGGARES